MAVKRYDGSAWQVVAGKGDQGTSSSISTWVKTASGGETSLSGNDDNSQSLSYTVGQELVFINGTLLKRGSDYTATNGTSITGLTALAANDVATVWTVNAFSVTNAISNTLVDAKGDLVTASGADVPARLAVGSNGQVLTADSTTGTGLKWETPAAGGKVLQMVTTSTTTTTTINTTSFTDTGMTATITPSSTSSKILVMSYSSLFLYRNASGGMGAPMKLVRNSSTDLFTRDYARYFEIGGTGSRMSIFDHSIIYVDSPSSTSALTYKIQARITTTADGGDSNWQNSGPGVMVLLEIGA